MRGTVFCIGKREIWPIKTEITFSRLVIILMYLFFAVRFSPDLLANGLLWMGSFSAFIFASIVNISKKGIACNFTFVKWYIIFCLFSIASLFWSNYKENVLEILKFNLIVFLAYTVIALQINNLEDFFLVIKIHMCAIFTCFVDMLLNLNWGLLFSYRLGLDNINSNWNSNTLGGSLASFVIFSFWLYKNKRIKTAFLLWGIDAIFLFFMFMTGSRKAIIMVTLFISFIQAFESKKKFWLRIVVSILVICAGYLLIMNVPALYNVLGYRLEGLLAGNSTEGSYIGRSRMIELGINWFWKAPILGYGANAFRAMSPWNTYAHNNYVELLVDLGSVGAFLYYSWTLYIIYYRKQIEKCKQYNWIISSLITILILDFTQVAHNDLLIISYIFFTLVLIDMYKTQKGDICYEHEAESI